MLVSLQTIQALLAVDLAATAIATVVATSAATNNCTVTKSAEVFFVLGFDHVFRFPNVSVCE